MSSGLLSAILNMTNRINEVVGLQFGESCLCHAGVHLDAFSMSLSHLGSTIAGTFLLMETHNIFYLH